jgi:hypothetical protein
MARLLGRAEHGDQAVLPALRAALDADPRLWDDYGDLALQAEAALGVRATGRNLYLGEALNRKLQAMKAELAGENPSPLERLLVARVVMTWLQTAYFDALVAQEPGASAARVRLIREQQEALSALRTPARRARSSSPAASGCRWSRSSAGPPTSSNWR